MKKSIRLAIISVLVLSAMAFSAYGVALAAPGLHLGDLFHSLSTNQITDVSTETPDVVETEAPDVTETPEATETPDVENDDNQGDEDDQGEDICSTPTDPTTGSIAEDCNSGGIENSGSSNSSQQNDQNDDNNNDGNGGDD